MRIRAGISKYGPKYLYARIKEGRPCSDVIIGFKQYDIPDDYYLDDTRNCTTVLFAVSITVPLYFINPWVKLYF